MSPKLAADIAQFAGEIFGSPAGNTWVKIRSLPVTNYAENDPGVRDPVCPVFVSVLKATLPAGVEMQREVTRLTAMIAQVCNRPAQNVHILYLLAEAGRVAFGGQLVGDAGNNITAP